MRVILNTVKASDFGQVQALQNQKNRTISPQINSKELSNFNSVGRSLVSFKGDEKNDALNLSEKSIKELEELKALYNSTQEELSQKKLAAQSNLDKLANWDQKREYRNQKTAAAEEIDNRELSRFFNPIQCRNIRTKHFNAYRKKVDEIRELSKRKDIDIAIIAATPLGSAQVALLIKQIDAMIAQKKQMEKQRLRQEGIDGVQRTINSIFNKDGGLNDRIAGYDYEKDEITKMFVEPLVKAKDDPSIKVPSAVLLHGATGTGKTTFLKGIGTQCSGFAEVVDLSVDIEAEDFPKEIDRQMELARQRYLEKDENRNEKKTRTILLINEAERFLSMTPEEAKILYGDKVFDDMDMEYMEQYGHDAKYINNFKSLLDTCSEAPSGIRDTGKGALTVFITSNYPHLIHPDLLSRDGKMPFIAINPAKDDNIEAVIKHYFKKANTLVEKIKAMDNPEGVDYLIGISKGAKSNIKQMMTTGTINKLGVDYENIPYDKFSKEFNPSMKKGAFSNDAYRKITEKSINMYLEDPSHTFEYYYTTNLIKEDMPKKLPNGVIIPSGRDINPQRYKKFVSIYNMLAPAEVDEKQILLKLEKMGLLDEKAAKRLGYIKIREAAELKNLEEKESENRISNEDKIRLQEIRTQNNAINNSGNEDEE